MTRNLTMPQSDAEKRIAGIPDVDRYVAAALGVGGYICPRCGRGFVIERAARQKESPSERLGFCRHCIDEARALALQARIRDIRSRQAVNTEAKRLSRMGESAALTDEEITAALHELDGLPLSAAFSREDGDAA